MKGVTITIDQFKKGIVSKDQEFLSCMFKTKVIPTKTIISVNVNNQLVEYMEYRKYLNSTELKEITDWIDDKYLPNTK